MPTPLTLQELAVLLVLQLRDALLSEALQLLQRTLAPADALGGDAAAQEVEDEERVASMGERRKDQWTWEGKIT